MKRLTIDIPESLHRAIKRRCAEQGIKIADVARELIGEWVRSDDPSTPKPDAAPAIRGYVYLLIDASGERFKIGRSIAPLMRIKQLPQEFDLATSRQVPVLGWRADKVENLLHGLFREQAVMMPPGDGYTEWFGIEAWDAVLAFLADHRERLGIGEPEAIPSRPALSDWTARRALMIEREAAQRANIIEHNRRELDRLREWLGALSEREAIVGIVDAIPLPDSPGWSLDPCMYLVGADDDLERWTETALNLSFEETKGQRWPVFNSYCIRDGIAQLTIFPPLLTMPVPASPKDEMDRPNIPRGAIRSLLVAHQSLVPADCDRLMQLRAAFDELRGKGLAQVSEAMAEES
ncbi:GIY-YIG nuclease family protein [Klebsiella quasipneumoniae]|uniref:GIY-YIG nuclease family protein n=1 Tax=Klebsiella quasipneumoniae TaxID=1463165 RepID=UPI00115AB49D|nr:GIY-YIG nuclease family protein [Klebsiella quasipneumoniae]